MFRSITDEFYIFTNLKCSSKANYIEQLELKIANYKKEIQNLSTKAEFYKKFHDKYLAAKNFFLNEANDDTNE